MTLRTSLTALAALPLLSATPALADGGLPAPLATLGRAHLLVLHFPIAVLFVLLAMAVMLRRVPDEKKRDVTRTLLWVALASTIAAVGCGLLYAEVEEFHGKQAELLAFHRNAGFVTLATTLGTVVAYLKFRRAYLPMLVWACVSVTFAGHGGGTMVHGEGYLLAGDASSGGGGGGGDGDEDADRAAPSDGDDAPEEARVRWPEGTVPAKPSYLTDIKPLIERSCVKCHGAEKRKGGLRLDKKRFAFKGGETGAAVVPGDAGESLLLKYISLPPDDEDVMPSKGKLLAQSEIDTFRAWIEQGAEWPDD